jgi:hypothetical protein
VISDFVTAALAQLIPNDDIEVIWRAGVGDVVTDEGQLQVWRLVTVHADTGAPFTKYLVTFQGLDWEPGQASNKTLNFYVRPRGRKEGLLYVEMPDFVAELEQYLAGNTQPWLTLNGNLSPRRPTEDDGA